MMLRSSPCLRWLVTRLVQRVPVGGLLSSVSLLTDNAWGTTACMQKCAHYSSVNENASVGFFGAEVPHAHGELFLCSHPSTKTNGRRCECCFEQMGHSSGGHRNDSSSPHGDTHKSSQLHSRAELLNPDVSSFHVILGWDPKPQGHMSGSEGTNRPDSEISCPSVSVCMEGSKRVPAGGT